MRLASARSTHIEITLSERNLLSLLSKLYTPGSARTIVSDGVVVHAEPDELHYEGREAPPGPMHPVTEEIVAYLQNTMTGRTL